MSVAAAASCTGWARAVCWVALLAGVWCVAFHVSHANAEEFCRRYVHDYTAEERLGLSPAFTFANGSLEWVSRVGSPDEDQGWDIAFSNETVFYVGYIGGTATFGNPSEQDLITVESYGLYDAYLLATTHDDGRAKWVLHAGGPFDDNAQGVAVTPDQRGVIMVGYFSEDATFTGAAGAASNYTKHLVASGNNVEAFIARYSTHDGSLEWAFSAGGDMYDIAWGVRMASSFALVFGYYQSTTFRMHVPSSNSHSGNATAAVLENTAFETLDYFIAAINVDDGSLRWLTGDGGLASDVILDASVLSDASTLAVGGYFSDSIVYSCPTCFGGTLTLTSAGGLDAYIATYNISTGNFVSAVSIGGDNDDVLLALTSTPLNRLAIAGWFESDTVALGNWTMVNRGLLDAFVGYIEAPGTGFAVGLNATNVLPHRSVKWLISPMWGPSQQSLSTIALTHRGDRVVVGGFTRGRSHYLEETGEVIEHTKGDSSTDMVIGSIALSDGTFAWRISPGSPLGDQVLGVAVSPVRVFFTGLQRSTAIYGGKMATESNVTIVAAGQTDAIVGSLGDVVPPLVAISTHTTLANDSLPVNVSFSEFALDFAVDDIQLSSGVATDLVVQEEGVSARFLVKDMADGFVTVGLRPGAVYDPIGNVNVIPTEPFTITFDGTPPRVGMFSPLWNPTSADLIPITVTFSECVIGFGAEDVHMSSGYAAAFMPQVGCERNKPYIVTFAVLGMLGGNFTANITEWAVVDVAGNGNENTATFHIFVDKSEPQVELLSSTPSPTNGNITITASFDVRVTEFALEDIIVSSGSKHDFIQLSETDFQFTLYRPAQGRTFVAVPPGVAFDDADNGNARSPEFETPVFDSIPPSVTLSTDSFWITNQDVDITVTFSEQVVGFSLDDLQLSIGSWAPLVSLNDTTFMTTVVDAPDGEIIVDLAPALCTDPAGNLCGGADTLRGVWMDRTPPNVTITTPNPRPTNDTIVLYIEFSEYVELTSFDLSKVTVSSGDVSQLELVSHSMLGTSWRCQVKNMHQGVLDVHVGVVLQDLALNWNLPSPQVHIPFDSIPPVPLVWSDTVSPTLDNVVMEVEFSEFVHGFDLGDVSILSGFPTNLTTLVPGLRYRFEVAEAEDGPGDAQVVAKSSQDPAGNGNVASNEFVGVITDRTNATVVLYTSMTGPSRRNLIVTAAFSEIVSGFAAGDVWVSSGSVQDVVQVEAPVVCPPDHWWQFPIAYAFTIVGADDGFPQAWVPGGVVIDVAGNPNDAADALWTGVEYDTTPPNCTLTTDLVGKTVGTSTLTVTVTFSELVRGFLLDDVILSSGWASNLQDATPAEYHPAWERLFDSCPTEDGGVLTREGFAPGVHYPNSSGVWMPAHKLGFSRFTFIIYEADNDRLTVNVRAGAAVDAAGNPTLPPQQYTVYKWPGWFTTVGYWQGGVALAAHIIVLVLLLAYWQARYMRLRFLGRVSLESTLEEHEEAAANEAKEKLRQDKAAQLAAKEEKRRKLARRKARKARAQRRRQRSVKHAQGNTKAGSKYARAIGADGGDTDDATSDEGSSADERYRQRKLARRRKSARKSVQRILAAATFKCSQCGCHNTVPADQIHVPSDLEWSDSSASEPEPHVAGAETKESIDAAAQRTPVKELTAAEVHNAHTAGANPTGILFRERAKQRAREKAWQAARSGKWKRKTKAELEQEQAAEERIQKLRANAAAMFQKTVDDVQLGSDGAGDGSGKEAPGAGDADGAAKAAVDGSPEIAVAVPRRLRPMVRTISGWKGKKPTASGIFNRGADSLAPLPPTTTAADKPPEPVPEPAPAPAPTPAEMRQRTRARAQAMRRRGRPRRPGDPVVRRRVASSKPAVATVVAAPTSGVGSDSHGHETSLPASPAADDEAQDGATKEPQAEQQ